MNFLVLAHASFWVYGSALSLQRGTVDLSGISALTSWLALMGLWLLFVARLSRSGWLAGAGVRTLPWLWVPMPPVLLSLVGLVSAPALRDTWLAVLAALPLIALPALNALRIFALGTVVKALRNQFPKRIGLAVGVPDTIFGIISALVVFNGGFSSERIELIWHVTGLMILILMIPMVFTVLQPSRLNAQGKGDARGILTFPMVLAPAGLATLFAILHCFALYQMLLTGQ
jgi:hypothetical protein